MPAVLVSACLVGINSRYDGKACPAPELLEQLRRDGLHVIPVCPEQLGGMPTPRPPGEISIGDGRDVLAGRSRIINSEGADVTRNHLRGAEEAVRLASLFGCSRAYLKEKSPACGVKTIKRGGATCVGMGVTAAALQAAGIVVTGVEPISPASAR